jgi:pimeloyl-ACP methyl ester carboxylesterase
MHVPAMPFADVPGARLFFTDEGNADGPPLLFIHGVLCDSHDSMWQLDAFSAAHRVIAVDLRGHGLSSPGGPYRPRDCG